MPAKTGKIPLGLKFGVALMVIAAGAVVATFALRATAIVAPVRLDLAVNAVPGSVVVYADGNVRELKSVMGGKVEWCEPLDPGRGFKEGEVLLRLDTVDLDREIEQARRNFDTAQQRIAVMFAHTLEWKEARQALDAALARPRAGKGADEEIARLQAELDRIAIAKNPERLAAEEALENARRLQQLGNASAEQVKQAERSLDAIETRLRLAQFDERKAKVDHEIFLKNKAIERERMMVKAPADGVVKETFVWRGALIGAGATVATVYSNDRIVVAKISEEDISAVKLGQPALVRLLSYPNEEFHGKVTKILPTADENTQRYTVYLDLEIDPRRLIPYSTGEVRITVGTRANRPLIPRRAIFNDNYVYVLKGARLERRQIKVGFISLNLAEVVEGLAPGERVVVEELDRFRAGQRVRVQEVKH